ncbi:MAG: GBS Bsp-like repeat-containing protein, partial [Oscillospiraceae bacterium]
MTASWSAPLRPDRGAEGLRLHRLGPDEATGLRMYSYNNAWHTGWFIIDPEVYCFDSNGIAYDGRVTLYGKQFVFDDGVVVSGPTGFVKRDDGKTLYFENGRIASGWKDIGDATYYFETSDLGDDFGVMYTGRRLIGKTWYEFGSDGRLYQLLRGRMSADEKEIVVTITPPAGQGRNYSNIMAAAWSQQDGQDDLVWYNATANGDGTYTIRVPMCKYNVVGRYLVHVYNHGIHGQLLDGLTFQNTHVVGHTDTVASDSSTCVSAGQVKYVCRYCGASHTSSTPAKRHTVSAVVDSECRTMTVTMDAGNGHDHSNVRFAVWSSVNGQDDLTWYTAKKNASGQWTYTVPLVNHNSTGTYFIHAYSSDSGQNRLIGNTTAQVAKLPAPDTVTAQVSDNCRTMSIRLDTARSYSGIRFAVWSSAGGQDDLVWYTAKNGGSGSWTYDVDLARHNTTGTYFIHVYSGNKLVAHTTAQVAKLPAPDTVTAQVSDNCRTMSIRLDTARSYSGIRFAVWSSAGGQDDLVWYTAKNGGSGSWTYDVDLARHNTTGTYFIHVYSGNKLVAHTTAQVKSLPAPAPGVKPGLTAAVSADNAAMELALTTTAKYGKVRFAVWSSANGQDDLVWYDGRLTGSTWSAGVKLLNHKTLGGYFIHVYADGKLVAHTTANVYGMPPQQSAQAIVTDDFAWMKLRLYSATGYSSIRFAVWSSAGGQDDLVWYKGENIGGAWVAAADLTRHNTTGTYFIHIYSGNKLVAHTT